MINNYSLSINNKEIFDFYNDYSLNFEEMNILFYNLIKQILQNNNKSYNENSLSILFNKISSIEQKLNNNQNEIQNKLNDYKKDFINDIKLILLSNNAEYIIPSLKETSNNLIDKTKIILNELIPQNQINLSREIDNNFKILQSQIIQETKTLNFPINQKSIDEFIFNSNNSTNETINKITNLINLTENRIENKLLTNSTKIDDIQKIINENNFNNSLLQKNITTILNKFEKGVGKGNISENILYNILLELYPTAEINYVGNQVKETGDIIFQRNNMPKILIENKDHESCNVPKHEIDKFIRDCNIQKCCGIMFSQNKGISNKFNYEIQINNDNILLYVHNVNFDIDKIKTSIDIVEQFKIKYDHINIDNNITNIDNSQLKEINNEFSYYINQKISLLKMVKDFNDKINISINELKMPCLENFLSKTFAVSSINKDRNMCQYCNKIIPKSLHMHYRFCNEKKKIDENNLNKILHT
jgi:hypothetical protein